MQIKRLVCLIEQSSLTNPDRSEVESIFEIELNGVTGFLQKTDVYDGRDCDSEYHASSEELAKELREWDEFWEFDEKQWQLEPETRDHDEAVKQIEQRCCVLVCE